MSIYEQEENERTTKWLQQCEREEQHRNALTGKECPNCGKPYDYCNGNCISDELPDPGWSLHDEGRSDGQGESYAERNV